MPDRDIVHANLPRFHQTFYDRLCEGQTSDLVLADVLLKAELKQLQRYGDAPISLLKSTADVIKNASIGELFQSIADWTSVRAACSDLALHTIQTKDANSRSLDIAQRAVRHVITEIEHGRLVPNIYQTLMSRYIFESSKADCLDRLRLTNDHSCGKTQRDIDQKIADVSIHLATRCDDLGAQIAKTHTVFKLRLPTTRTRQSVTINTPLTDLIN